jgi:uncharacterized protein YcnI
MVAVLAVAIPTAAAAHIGVAVDEAPVGSTFRVALAVGHGCAGAPTTAIRVQIPEGFYNVKPMAKAGWQIETVIGSYATPFESHGNTLTEGVTEISWSGNELPDSFFDEFVFRGTFGAALEPGSIFHFPVIQQCGDVEDAWIDTSGAEDAEYPAPSVTLTPAEGHAH